MKHRSASRCLLAMGAVALSGAVIAAEPPLVTFDSDPQWDGFRNRLRPENPPLVRQDFGYRRSQHAGGRGAGEIGGIVHRAYRRAYYAKPIGSKTLNDPLSASGKFAITSAGGASGVLCGWFHEDSRGWRTPNSLAFRCDGNGGKYWVFFEYGTGEWGTGGGGVFEGERYQTTPTPPFPADGTVHDWSLTYDPQGAEGRGLVRFRIDQQDYAIALRPGHKEQMTRLNRFGIWAQETPGDPLEFYVDDLELDGALHPFDEDPSWVGEGNDVRYKMRIQRPFHDVGYSKTQYAGGQPGEIGGIMFRDERPAYYAARVGPLNLDDELFASGTIVLRSAGADSAIMLGWLGSDAKRGKQTPEYQERQTDYLGVLIEGPSRVGHYFRAAYSTAQGAGAAPTHEGEASERPRIRPNGEVHRWSIHYDPEAAAGRGRIKVTFDDNEHLLELAPGERQQGATLDRFGLFNVQSGGHHVEVYLDDLRLAR